MALEISRVICVNCQDKLFTVEDTTGIYNATSNAGGWGAPNPETSNVVASYIRVTLNDGTIYVIDTFPVLPNTSGTLFTVLNTDLGLALTEQFADNIATIDYVVLGIQAEVLALTGLNISPAGIGTIQIFVNGVAISGVVNFTGNGNANATAIFNSINAFGSGYTVTLTNIFGNYVLFLYAPIGSGSSVNGYTVTAVLTGVAAFTNTTLSGGVSGVGTFTYTCGALEVFMCNALCCVNEKMADIDVGCGCKTNNETEQLFLMLKGAEYAAQCGKQEKSQALLDYVNDKCENICTNC